ncbi:MAG: M23 family metallopeptidase [Geobacteraceae bacterium]|nr:M23 family metallopeptidase [Geobacteraceae bacterium]
MVLVVLSIAALLPVPAAHADFYKYVNKDGVECYTNAPVSRKAVLFLREPRPRPATSGKSAAAGHPGLRPGPSATSLQQRVRDAKPALLPVTGTISSVVGLRYDPLHGMLRNHNGVDIAVPEGTPVRSVAPGVVSYSGSRGGYGNLVIVEHDDGTTTLYAHNRENLVATGTRVTGSSILAHSGSTGRSTGPHLHFEAWYQGENITTEFLGDTPMKQRYAHRYASIPKRNPIRKLVMADGTILLTNIPLVHP